MSILLVNGKQNSPRREPLETAGTWTSEVCRCQIQQAKCSKTNAWHFALLLRFVSFMMGGRRKKKKSNVFSSCVNFLRVKAAPQSQKPTVRKSATRMVCPTPSVTQTLNTCPAPWRQSTGRTLITALYIHTHTYTHTQSTKQKITML